MPMSPALTRVEEDAARAAGGDEQALERLFDHHSSHLVGWLTRRLNGDRHLAEDIAQNTWVNVARSIRRYKPREGASFRSWLCRIAINEVSQHYRAMDSRPTTTYTDDHAVLDQADWRTPEAIHDKAATQALLNETLMFLSPDQREALTLRYTNGLDIETTATLMGRKPGAVKQLTFRGVQALRRRLAAAPLDFDAHHMTRG